MMHHVVVGFTKGGGPVKFYAELLHTQKGRRATFQFDVFARKTSQDPHSGGAGLIHALADIDTWAPGWDEKRFHRAVEFAERWHLNDMRAGCEHQREERWDKRPIDPSKPLAVYGKHFPGQTQDSWNMLTWVRPEEHPEGLLTAPCPVCGYRFGTKWLMEDMPDEAVQEMDDIFSDPAAETSNSHGTDKTLGTTALLEQWGLTLKSEFVPWSQSRNAGSGDPSLNWRVSLFRGETLITEAEFTAGWGHTNYARKKIVNIHTEHDRQQIVKECETGRNHGLQTKSQPNPKDVLRSFVLDAQVLNYPSFESWASDFGYSSDSIIARKIYDASLAQGLRLKNGLGDDLFTQVCEAFES